MRIANRARFSSALSDSAIILSINIGGTGSSGSVQVDTATDTNEVPRLSLATSYIVCKTEARKVVRNTFASIGKKSLMGSRRYRTRLKLGEPFGAPAPLASPYRAAANCATRKPYASALKISNCFYYSLTKKRQVSVLFFTICYPIRSNIRGSKY